MGFTFFKNLEQGKVVWLDAESISYDDEKITCFDSDLELIAVFDKSWNCFKDESNSFK
ncbi:hypothetical protein [Aquimarina algiphila]|uniref:hypothetical protein n=1 Tax=Aquimarina algiphila TaxID=2047982 RepID=UPI0014300CEF|nr:hypothetical protein [Aquimarina algiphila]